VILALDCSSPRALLSLELPDGRRLERISPKPREHADWVQRSLAELGEAAGRSWRELERVALTVGPGSFTGLRVGLAAAKGLVYDRAIPLVPLSSLALPALAHRGKDPVSVLVCRPARGRELWVGLFPRGSEEASWEKLRSVSELAADLETLRATEREARFVGSLPPGLAPDSLPGAPAPEPSAAEQVAVLARLARESETLLLGAARDELLPRYLLEPAVTLPKPRPGAGGEA